MGYSVNQTAYSLAAHLEESVFETLRSEWNELLHRSTSDRVFSTWEWQSSWWDAYQPGDLWVLTYRDDEGRLMGIAPWFIQNHPELGRVVRSIGCIEVTDYLDIIVDKEQVETVLEAFATYTAFHHERYDRIDLCNLPEGQPGQAIFPAILSRHGFDTIVKVQEVCPIIQLPSSWDDYLNSLDKKQRHELRRKLRRTEGAAEMVDWYIVGERHNLEDEIEQFLQLMSASHPDKASFLQDPQNENFFRKIVPIAYRNHWLQLSFLTVNGERAAAYLNFVYNGRVLVYNSGLLSDKYGQLSAGIVLLARNIQHAIEAGYSIFDFLRGNEIYKYRMGAQDTRVYMLQAAYMAN
jgi:CelD/BcsL family acetyltransferase involved in cellulose biosynthesis